MPQVINTNIPSLNAQRNLDRSQGDVSQALQRLSSGLRINSAKDDAAGMAIAERMTSQVRGMNQARRNANDGVSLAQVGEGALEQMGNILQRVRELAVQSANATNSASDRAALNSEVGQLTSELQRFAISTEFNGQKLFDGTFGSAIYQVGANANQTITATTNDFRTNKYGTYQLGVANSYGAPKSNSVSGAYLANTAVTGSTVATAGPLTINGAAGSASVPLTTSDSVKTIAAAINNVADKTGVSASARTEASITFSASGSYKVAVMGSNSTEVAVSFALSAASGNDSLTAAVNAFNEQTSKTGITARMTTDNTGIVLVNDEGANISLAGAAAGDNTGAIALQSSGTGVVNATLGAGAAGTLTVGGQLTVNSDKSYSLGGAGSTAVLQTGVIQASGTYTSSTAISAVLQQIAELDVTSSSKATQVLRTVDSALAAISSQRASFGALQSRFESTIANLQTSVENLSSSRSRIRDADFAAETAALTRAQVLQQAGTAMLAQANQLPQSVLSLLQG